MISFLLEEGVITVGTLSGIFTAAMLNSFRLNIIEPVIENIFPSNQLDLNNLDDPKSGKQTDKQIKWQTFLRDFLVWCLVMYLLYIFWKNVLHKYTRTK